MREFLAVPHGAGKNFLGALQSYIEGNTRREQILARIGETNLFDGDWEPVNFVRSFHPRTQWNKDLIHCQAVTEQLLYKRIASKTAEQEIRTAVNRCHEGSFCFGYTIPHVSMYSAVCVLDSARQRIWLDDLAMLKKEDVGPDPNRQSLAIKLFEWEVENLPNYRAEWCFDYTSFFLVKDPETIKEFLERTCRSRSIQTTVTVKDLQELIELYSIKNNQLLEQYD